MGRFTRRRSRGRDWVRRLPDRFTLDDLAAAAGTASLNHALGWLYDSIERGRINPIHMHGRLFYEFLGTRRAGDKQNELDGVRTHR
jgi:hypothetical protein